jgi:two-component sensor histidine kinase
MITELVSNSVVHGHAGPADPISVQVTIRRCTIRGEVSDSGPGFTPTKLMPSNDVGGLGLVIVNRCSTRWGTTHHGRRVWFELDRGSTANGAATAPAPRGASERYSASC